MRQRLDVKCREKERVLTFARVHRSVLIGQRVLQDAEQVRWKYLLWLTLLFCNEMATMGVSTIAVLNWNGLIDDLSRYPSIARTGSGRSGSNRLCNLNLGSRSNCRFGTSGCSKRARCPIEGSPTSWPRIGPQVCTPAGRSSRTPPWKPVLRARGPDDRPLQLTEQRRPGPGLRQLDLDVGEVVHDRVLVRQAPGPGADEVVRRHQALEQSHRDRHRVAVLVFREKATPHAREELPRRENCTPVRQEVEYIRLPQNWLSPIGSMTPEAIHQFWLQPTERLMPLRPFIQARTRSWCRIWNVPICEGASASLHP